MAFPAATYVGGTKSSTESAWAVRERNLTLDGIAFRGATWA